MANRYVVAKTLEQQGNPYNVYKTIEMDALPQYESEGYRIWSTVNEQGEDIAYLPQIRPSGTREAKKEALLGRFLTQLQTPVTIAGKTVPAWALLSTGTAAAGATTAIALTALGGNDSNQSAISGLNTPETGQIPL